MKKDIYIIKNKINNKVYIGQSINAAERWLKHLSDAKLRPNNQLIHKAMNKYGVENFYYQILEYQIEDYDNKEQEYIKRYNSLTPNGYNISIGGKGIGAGCDSPNAKLSKEQLSNLVEDLTKTDISLNKLAKKYNICQWTITSINNGKAYFNENLSYPLRDTRKYNLEKVKQIKYSLKYELDKTLTQIAEEYQIDCSNLNDINQGKIHKYENETYPLRKGKITPVSIYVDEIINLLINSNLSQKDIARKFNVSAASISNINQGKSFKKDDIIYPLRNNYQGKNKRECFSPDQLILIEDELKNNTKSMRQIAKEFECSVNVIIQINNGSIKKYRKNNIKYPLRNK